MNVNELKYGKKESDIISIQFKMSKQAFIGFCFGNIQKYLHRFDSESEKANNPKDIEKVIDYISRFEEKYPTDVNLERLKNLIEVEDFKTAFIHSIDLQEFLINEKCK
jgi:hypothetical protein